MEALEESWTSWTPDSPSNLNQSVILARCKINSLSTPKSKQVADKKQGTVPAPTPALSG